MDGIRATPYINPLLGSVNELVGGLLGYMRDPRRTQQLQGLAGLLESTGVPKTLERLAYGEPLTNIQRANVPVLRPETAEALLTLSPVPQATSRAAMAAGRAGERMAERVVPQIMERGGMPAGLLQDLAQGSRSQITPQISQQMAREAAEKIGQSADPYTRSLQQGYEHDWYHGTTGDITRFRKDLLGEATGAESAKKGFFFARDPQNPPEAMLKKSSNPAAEEMLRNLGIPEEEIAKLNTVSMKGYGAETASGYAQIGGSRQYKEAMRKAKAAEKRRDWDEYESQMALAEDIAIKDQRYFQDLTAKYGDKRDEMLESINNLVYSKQLPQQEAEALDAKIKQLMPYGWYNSYSNPQIESLKKELVKIAGDADASNAIKSIEQFQSIKNERLLAEKTQEGSNVMPVALRYKNPLVYDFQGSTYRDQTYADLVDQAIREGKDAVILKNTYDPGAGPSKLIDVGVVFDPSQIRSRFAAFDPTRMREADILAGVLPLSLLADEEQRKKTEDYFRSLLGQ